MSKVTTSEHADLHATSVETESSIDMDFINNRVADKIDRLQARHNTAQNTVKFYLRGNSGSYVSVMRLTPTRLQALNSTEHNTLHGMNFDRAYSVFVSYSFRDPITGNTRSERDLVANVGVIGKQKYLLTNNGSVATQTRTGQDEDVLLRTIGTIARAKKLAETKGVYNDDTFFLDLPNNGATIKTDYIVVDSDGFDI